MTKCVTYVSVQVLPMSPVYTRGRVGDAGSVGRFLDFALVISGLWSLMLAAEIRDLPPSTLP